MAMDTVPLFPTFFPEASKDRQNNGGYSVRVPNHNIHISQTSKPDCAFCHTSCTAGWIDIQGDYYSVLATN